MIMKSWVRFFLFIISGPISVRTDLNGADWASDQTNFYACSSLDRARHVIRHMTAHSGKSDCIECLVDSIRQNC